MIKKLLLILSFISVALATPPLKVYESVRCEKGTPAGIVPYFANLYATNMLLGKQGYFQVVKHRKDNIQVVADYVVWYFQNLNYPDKWGLTGTIYDFYVVGNQLYPTYNYDSADAYAGTFLTLFYFYLANTNDMGVLAHNLNRLKDIAYVILALKDSGDGLVKALPYRNVKYLIDNLEAYAGLALFSHILWRIGDEDWRYYQEHAIGLKESIKNNFYSNGILYWAIEDGIKYPVVGNQVYPDHLALLFWKAFNGERIENRDIITLDCVQRVAIKVFSFSNSQILSLFSQ